MGSVGSCNHPLGGFVPLVAAVLLSVRPRAADGFRRSAAWDGSSPGHNRKVMTGTLSTGVWGSSSRSEILETGNTTPTTPAHRLCVKLICSFPPARPCSCRCHRRTKQALLCLLRRHYVCFRLLAASGNKGPSEETCTVVSRTQTWDLRRPSNSNKPLSADQILGSPGLRQTSPPASCLF